MKKTFSIMLLIILSIAIMSCSSEKQEEQELTSFYIDASTQYGFSPNRLTISHGAKLNIKAYEMDMTISEEQLGISEVIPAGKREEIVVKGPPGTYALYCNNCAEEGKTLTIKIH